MLHLIFRDKEWGVERITSGGDAVVHISVYISFYLISRTNCCLKLRYTGLLTSFFNWLFYMESDNIIKQQNVIMNCGLHLKNKLCYFFRLVKHRLLSVIFLGRTVVSVHSLSSQHSTQMVIRLQGTCRIHIRV